MMMIMKTYNVRYVISTSLTMKSFAASSSGFMSSVSRIDATVGSRRQLAAEMGLNPLPTGFVMDWNLLLRSSSLTVVTDLGALQYCR